ncbi:MAG: DUF4296 domain-containing protein [Bacteroidetes bacterium]|nr:MAG: DUF4296 domain-containing protein [Bacteroidota bacterium]
MKRTYLSVILLSFLLALGACKQEQMPEGIIPQAEMKEILKSIHLANAMGQRTGNTLEQRNANRQELYNAIFSRFGVDRETFYNSYLYYLDHPEKLDPIYKDIITELNEAEPIENEYEYESRRKKDLGTPKPIDKAGDTSK